MGPTETYSNDYGTGICPMMGNRESVTYSPTYHYGPDVKEEDLEEAAREINRLEAMMHCRGCHEESKHSLQHREIKRARCAPMKHKKPHMNRRIIR